MPDLRICKVTADGEPGEVLGTIRLDGDQIEPSAGIAEETVVMLRRRSRLDDSRLFDRLTSDGWSNGQVVITQ